MMGVSQSGIGLIKHFEGLSLTSYRDVAGIWTIGYGHTEPDLCTDQEISEDEAESLLRWSRGSIISGLRRLRARNAAGGWAGG